MMKLLSSPLSPYGRKVKITAAMKGIGDRMAVVFTDSNAADNAELKSANPLLKIPALVLADGSQIFDSAVICEYLDSLALEPRLIPASGPARWHTLTLGALGDGILDAAILMVYEKRFRPEALWHADWLARQQKKIDSALDALEATPPVWAETPDYGHITIACALGYLDFRHDGKWRDGRAGLVAWHDRFADAVPAFAVTKPKV